MKPKHLEFVLNYLGTKDPAVAYGQTYPNASYKSFSAGASRILARPDVQDYIQFTERRMEDRLLTQIEAEQEAKKQQLLSINEKRAVLTKIITGETKRVRFIKNKYGPQKVEEDLPVYAVLRAVDMDTRLETFYNILLHRQDWSTQQSRTTYINTPTLQQQVNILISQTTANRHCDEVSATSDTQEAISRNAESRLCESSLLQEKTPKQILSHTITCPPLQLLPLEQSAQEKSPVRGFRGPLAPEKNPLQLTTNPDSNRVNSLTPLKKNINQLTTELANSLTPLKKNDNKLTKVNKTEKPIYNTTTKSTTDKKPENPEKSAPGRRKREKLPPVTPLPSIDYNPYTLEPLDPNIDYSYNPNQNHEKAPSHCLSLKKLAEERAGEEAPIPGKITVGACMKEYD